MNTLSVLPPWLILPDTDRFIQEGSIEILLQPSLIHTDYPFHIRTYATAAGISLKNIPESQIGSVAYERASKLRELLLQQKKGEFFFSLH